MIFQWRMIGSFITCHVPLVFLLAAPSHARLRPETRIDPVVHHSSELEKKSAKSVFKKIIISGDLLVLILAS